MIKTKQNGKYRAFSRLFYCFILKKDNGHLSISAGACYERQKSVSMGGLHENIPPKIYKNLPKF